MDGKHFINAEETAKLAGVSKTTAYNILRQLNRELEKKGYMTIRGKAPRRYFLERFGLSEEDEEERGVPVAKHGRHLDAHDKG